MASVTVHEVNENAYVPGRWRNQLPLPASARPQAAPTTTYAALKVRAAKDLAESVSATRTDRVIDPVRRGIVAFAKDATLNSSAAKIMGRAAGESARRNSSQAARGALIPKVPSLASRYDLAEVALDNANTLDPAASFDQSSWSGLGAASTPGAMAAMGMSPEAALSAYQMAPINADDLGDLPPTDPQPPNGWLARLFGAGERIAEAHTQAEIERARARGIAAVANAQAASAAKPSLAQVLTSPRVVLPVAGLLLAGFVANKLLSSD